jgi:hypothetical protein
MNGLTLARSYFEAHGLPLLEEQLPPLRGRVAVGLVGPGSECWGYDDEFSRDHDWGPSFCLWLMPEDMRAYGAQLQQLYAQLPQGFAGFAPRQTSAGEEGRVGVIDLQGFYRRYTGLSQPPQTTEDWLRLPDQGAAVCTNGALFHDPLGEFSRWRESLLAFYPEDLRRLKIASLCMSVAQSGQYNFARSVQRSELVAARYFETQFCAETIALLFQLNRRFRPFYKWAHRSLLELPILGEPVGKALEGLARSTDESAKAAVIEEICGWIVAELQRQGLSDATSDFLLDHGPVIHSQIESQRLRSDYPLARRA